MEEDHPRKVVTFSRIDDPRAEPDHTWVIMGGFTYGLVMVYTLAFWIVWLLMGTKLLNWLKVE